MTLLLWLAGAAVVMLFVGIFGGRVMRRGDVMGSLSAQWLHEYRRETHQD